jgi:hypothetical protein
MNTQLIFNFEEGSDLKNWNIVDDVVMGGHSSGSMALNPEGHGIFSGDISLENNGGFSSVRYEFPSITVNNDQLIRIRLKGDGKRYQFRVKHEVSDYASYTSYFETTGEWQDVEFRLGDLYPTFRGRKLDRPDFDHDSIEEIRFLIGNNRPESFKLLIDNIELITE